MYLKTGLPFLLSMIPAAWSSTCSELANRPTRFTGSQTHLVQHIVSLAFVGLADIETGEDIIGGIMWKSAYEGVEVDLGSWFRVAGLLDGGDVVPLVNYAAGAWDDVKMKEGSRQELFFTNFFHAFGLILGCPNPPPPAAIRDNGLELRNLACYNHTAYLNEYERSFMIDQIVQSASFYGFPDTKRSGLDLGIGLHAQYHFDCTNDTLAYGADQEQILGLCKTKSCEMTTTMATLRQDSHAEKNNVLVRNVGKLLNRRSRQKERANLKAGMGIPQKQMPASVATASATTTPQLLSRSNNRILSKRWFDIQEAFVRLILGMMIAWVILATIGLFAHMIIIREYFHRRSRDRRRLEALDISAMREEIQEAGVIVHD